MLLLNVLFPLGLSKLLFDCNFSIFIVVCIDCVVPSFAVIFIVKLLLPVEIVDISTLPSNPALSPLGYPGYALFTSALVVPYLTVPKSFPSTYTLTSFTPLDAKAQPLTFKVLLLTVSFPLGLSKLLLDCNLSTFIVVSIDCVVPSFAVILTVNFLLPAEMLDISTLPSNPALSPLGYPGCALFTSALTVPYLTVPKSFSSTYTLTSFIPLESNAQPLIFKVSPVAIVFPLGSSKLLFVGNFEPLTTIFLVWLWVVPSFATITTCNVLLPSAILLISTIAENPELDPL